ncbi:MAG TPA: hypothetical protein VFG94_12820 [Acidimicrobiales bacterium]|jgi:hypothetical protein|nr:hypothetical protein [Acidimicrobiales bacterium]
MDGRWLALGGAALFMGGCWAGMRSESSGTQYCVVVPETVVAHPGFTAGQFVEAPEGGCLDGEPEVCGHFEGSDEDRHFESDSCP